MLSFSSLSVKSIAVIYDRLSTKDQIVSFETHLPILRSAVANSGIKFDEIHEITEIGSAFNNHESLQLYGTNFSTCCPDDQVGTGINGKMMCCATGVRMML